MHPDRWIRIVTELDPKESHRDRIRSKREDLSTFQLDCQGHAQDRKTGVRKGRPLPTSGAHYKGHKKT